MIFRQVAGKVTLIPHPFILMSSSPPSQHHAMQTDPGDYTIRLDDLPIRIVKLIIWEAKPIVVDKITVKWYKQKKEL